MPKPYWIVAPPYTHISSGVRTLHKLVDGLKARGQRIALEADSIVVYPDITVGNPINAKNVCRYLLAPAGKYGGSAKFPGTDMIWGAHRYLAENVLTIPVSDPKIFYPPLMPPLVPLFPIREGECFYSHKYEMHGNKLPYLAGVKRVCGTLKEVAEILRTSVRCYVFELTSVIQEAALCGCPVTLMRTPYFNKYDASISMMIGDIAWDDCEVVCKMGVEQSRLIYTRYESNYQEELDDFITRTQERFA